MNPGQELDGRVAVVTGAGRGIGAAVARRLCGNGAAVVAVDRDAGNLERVVADLRALGAPVHPIICDLAAEDEVAAAMADARTHFGRVDAFVASAGLLRCVGLLSTPLALWDELFAVNLRSVYLCLRELLPPMIEAGSGVVVGISSDCVVRSCRESAGYMASKAGLVALMKSVAVDHGPDGIRANIVTPGVTDTPGLRRVYSTGRELDASLDRAAAQSPLGRIGRPDDVAAAVAFVCSDNASYITGAELMVDGGMTVSYAGD